ncbi:MAG TPA: phage baseplate assembly protein V, partial [Kofleriaceae bacterium]
MEELVTDLARRAQDKYYGKYRGFVVCNKDPDQLGRLQLRIPSVLGAEVTDWALPCLPFGGTAGLGWFVIPEQDAQVWVEFEEGELRRPIWTGTFWQKTGDPPQDAQKTPPTTRLLQTPSGHILQLDDEDGKEQIRLHHAGGAELLIDENGTITITDPAGSQIAIDADQGRISIADTNDNAITMSSTGVKIEDGNDNSLELAASGVTISSGGQIVLDAKAV